MAYTEPRTLIPFPTKGNDVVLITHADSDAGYYLARKLLAAGNRVVAVARYPSPLTHILLGQSASQVVAIAADIDDGAQWARLLERAQARLGSVTIVVDGQDDG
jgi:NAD(P)-dependent dehydrogenase (short-subunit alcohol dehydrogenase family)